MSFGRGRRFSAGAAWVVAGVLCVGGLVHAQPARDTVSDGVGATFGEFRVDETGNANYSIPIYAPPGTAGVAPKVALTYNSGGGNGWIGKGWAISGLSSITRCRKTREAGDFFDGGTPVDGNSKPVTYSNQDVFCLDGMRLLLVSGAYGADNTEYRLETDPFTKITSVSGDNGTTSSYSGPNSFVVRRKDGSTSYYGNTTDSRIKAISCAHNPSGGCFPTSNATWAINRFEDSTGNYIDYAYTSPEETPYVTDGTQYLPLSITWTGKRQLAGQGTAASAPYAGIYFRHLFRVPPAGQDASNGWQGGRYFVQDQELVGVEVKDQIDTGSPRTLRYYRPTYGTTTSGSGVRLLRSIEECRSNPYPTGTQNPRDPNAVCYRPTTLKWSDEDGVAHGFATADTITTAGETRNMVSSRIGDVDGDGRADIVWFRAAGSSPLCPGGNHTQVSFGDRQEVGGSKLVVTTPAQAVYCSYLTASTGELNPGWGLIDFDGDGRDDLIVADNDAVPGARWHVYPSLGRPQPGGMVFDTTNDLLPASDPIATADHSENQAQLGDFNGDGMIDLFLRTNASTWGFAVRFLRRKADGTGFEFSPAYAVPQPTITSSCGANCNYSVLDAGHSSSYGVVSDLNGDGRSDIVIGVRTNTALRNATGPLPSATAYSDAELEQLRIDEVLSSGPPQFFAMVMDQKTSTQQEIKQYGGVLYSYGETLGVSARVFQFADFNGDSLPDLFYRPFPSQSMWYYAINRGDGFQRDGEVKAYTSEVRDIPNGEHIQLVDIDGDARAEILFPSEIDASCPGSTADQRVYRSLSFNYLTAGFGGFLANPNDSARTNATCISGNTVRADNPSQWDHFFADFDGDGDTDFLKLRKADVATVYSSRAATTSRFKAKDVITGITNGHGAFTSIFYQPLTNKAIYRREKGSRLDPAPDAEYRDPDGNIDKWGRGSPVIDVISSQYVVSAISSSAPTRADPAGQSAIGYRYLGAKVQAGGRGMLGFARIVTFDAAPVDGGWAATEQFYRQDFPFIGAPLQTNKYVLSGAITRGSAEIDACSADPEASGYDCFYDPAVAADAEHPSFGTSGLGGKIVRVSASLWGCKANGTTETCDFPASVPPDSCPSLAESFSILAADAEGVAPISVLNNATASRVASGVGGQQPLFPYVPRTIDLDYDPVSGAMTRHVCGLFQYGDGFGNATTTSISTYSGASTSNALATKQTVSSFVNDETNWRLGRMMTSVIDDTRGSVTKSRMTDFDYEVDRQGVYSSATDTGLLKSERLQNIADPLYDNQDLRTLYTLDDYGNQTYAFQCSRKKIDGTTMTDADCRNTGLVQQRPVGATGPTTAVHRYTRHAYTANGRYLTASYVPYYSPTAPRNVSEQASMTISARDEFGNPTSATDANGNVTTSLSGTLNRAYYVADSTGKSVTTAYRWCDQLANACPSGASFRQAVATAGAPTTFTYFDVLGRPMLKVGQSFNAAVSGKNWTAACVAYDNHGREEFSSVPFFLSAAYGTAPEPTFTGGSNPCTGVSSATITTYDVLGRVRLAAAPDGSSATSSFSGLTTTTTDSRGLQSSQAKNALGEVVTMMQADAASGALAGNTLTVTQTYDEQGNLRFVQRNAGNGVITSEVQYDQLGRKTKVIDPDRGTTTYEYNAAGEVIRSTNALGTRVEQDYDALGRVWRRVAGASGAFGIPVDSLFRDGFEDAGASSGLLLTDEWQFDTASDGLGALDFERRTISGTPGTAFFRAHTYDVIGRLVQRQTSFDAATYTESTAYDGLGRVQTQTDASGDASTNAYTPRGYLSHTTYSLASVGTTGKFYEVLEQDAWGHVTSERRNGTMITLKAFDQQRGWVDTVSTVSGSLQNWNFDFDTNGNLIRRNKGGGALIEDLTYDKLNRLTQVSLSGSATTPLTTSVAYDKLGNLCTKGALSYTYEGADGCNTTGLSGRPHAVTQAGSITYLYDPLGNQIVGNSSSNDADDHTFSYDAYEQVELLTRGNVMATMATYEAEFAYGPDRARYRRIDRQSGAVTRTTRYVGNVEIIIAGGVTHTKRYLAGGAIVTTYSNQPSVVEDRYALSDHLGSVDVVVNDTGGIVESTSFDAWGQRRGTGNWQGPGGSLATTTRGFTGHEHVDAIGLIHMNGRIYDPVLGRFTQSDPLIDAGIQGLNRYSYVLNNPLSFTDPTGHLTWGEWVRVGIGIAVSFATVGTATGPLGASLSIGEKAFLVGAGGALIGAGNSNSLKGAGWGAVSALAFYGIGSYFESASWAHNGKHVFGTNLDLGGYAAKVLSHGVAGGALQHLQGGRFGSGFAAAGVTQAFSGGVEAIDPANPGFSVQGALVSALIGGVTSDLTGDKFAHGALTAAFAYAFNSSMHEERAFKKLVQANTTDIMDMYSTPGEDLVSFAKRVGQEELRLSNANGYEYTAALSEKSLPGGGTSYGALIQTQGSHIFSAPTKIPGGYSALLNPKGGYLTVHSHGVSDNRKVNAMDNAFNPMLKVGRSVPRQIRDRFSEHDYDNPGFLAAPKGLMKWDTPKGSSRYQQIDLGPY